jgi:hypothetical protein
MTILKDLKAKQSRAAQVRSQLDYPVIDTDSIPMPIVLHLKTILRSMGVHVWWMDFVAI